MYQYELFIEFKKNKIVLLVVKLDNNETQTEVFKEVLFFEKFIIDKISEKNYLILAKKIVDLESKLNFHFKDCVVLLQDQNYKIIRASSFKKNLNNKITKQDIEFNLNNLKSILDEQEYLYKLIHIFNSKFVIDNKTSYDLPINHYCKYFKQENTFVYLPHDTIKQYYDFISRCNLNIKKLIHSDFALLSTLSKEYNLKDKSLIYIKIKKNHSAFFNMSHESFIEHKKYNFGSKIIYQDIIKISSLNEKEILDKIQDSKNNDINLNNIKTFKSKKITKEFLLDIAQARLEEILNIIIKNINFRKSNNNKNLAILLSFEDENLKGFLKAKILEFFKNIDSNLIFTQCHTDQFRSCRGATSIFFNGWEKEAIPLNQAKQSFLTKIFKKLLGLQ